MAKLTKRRKIIAEKVTIGKVYDINEALSLLRSLPPSKFDESVDVAINLGIDPKKSDQVVRGATVLPNGSGKTVRVAVFAQGENVKKAEEAGADIVGFDDLAATIKGGDLDFDVVIATPDAMRVVGQLGQVLGPRGLMPNPKVGTVTADVETAVKNAKAGQVRYRADKAGIVHCSLGKIAFENDKIIGNLEALLKDLVKSKPATAKGVYMQKISVSTTHGPGLSVEHSGLDFK